MAEMPTIEREGSGYRIRPQGPLPRSFINSGTILGISLAGTAYMLLSLGAATLGWGAVSAFLTSGLGMAAALGAVATTAVAGNILFQRSQDKIEREGALLEEPGFFNRGLFAGLMNGFGKAAWISLGASLVGLAGAALFGAPEVSLIKAMQSAVAIAAPYTLAIGGALGVLGGIRGSREYRDNVQQQISNIENGILYREAALARGQQPDLETARSAAIGNSLGVAAVTSPAIAAKTGVLGGIGANGGLMSQEPQFTEYAYNGEGYHPAHDRPADAPSFAEMVRPRRQPVPAVAVASAAPASSPEAQGFASRVEALREQMAQVQSNARPT